MAPKTPITAPKALLDAHIHHQVNMGRYATGVVHDVVGLLNEMDKELVKLVQDKVGATTFTVARMEKLLEETQALIADASTELTKSTVEKLADYAEHEASWGKTLLEKMTFGLLDIVQPDTEKLVALVTDKPFQGALLHEWFDKLAVDKQHNLRQQIRLGQSLGETTDQIVSRVRGTNAGNFKDGVLEISRQHTAAVVRTATNHTSNHAQQLLLKENDDLIQGWTFLATLDGRTTLICASLSGTKWPIGEGPIPPRHFQCRSFALMLLKTWKEMGINIDEIPAGQRAAVGGPVSVDISFSDWLKTQPHEMQDEILGKTRAELFRKGGLTVDKFTDNLGNVLTLDELKAKEAAAFKSAFGEGGGPHGSGGGHLGKNAPVPGPMDFSHVINPDLHPEAIASMKKQQAAEEKAAQAKSAKAEYMKKYNAEKKLKVAAELAAQEAQAAAALAQEAADKEAMKAAYKEAYVKGEPMDAAHFPALAKMAPDELQALTQEADQLKQAAQAQAAKLLEAKDAYIKFLSEGAPLDMELQKIVDALPSTEKSGLQSQAKELKAAAEDQAKKWGMYKSKIKPLLMEDKPLPPAFQKVFDAAPAAEKNKLLGAVEEAKTAKAEKDAAAKAIKEAEDKAAAVSQAKEAYEKWLLDGTPYSHDIEKVVNSIPAAELKAIQGKVEALKAAAESAVKANEKVMTPELDKKWGMYKSKIKKLLLEGKDLTPSFQSVFDALPQAEKDKFMSGIVKDAVAAPAKEQVEAKIAAKAEKKLPFSDFEKLEGAKGSNEGGLYLNKATGEKWYIKTPGSDSVATNEVVANHLYELAGVKVPQTQYIDVNGRLSIASKWVDGVTKNAELIKSGKGVAGIVDGFAVDAWLANWDVVGLGYDNLLVEGKTAVRIDNGGSLLYRAQGGLKGSAFGREVTELDSLRNSALNPQSASVFGKISQRELEASVSKVLSIPDSEIVRIVREYGAAWTMQEQQEVIQTLVERKQWLAEKFPQLLKEEPAAPIKDAGKRVTAAEAKQVKDARINGHSLPIDKDAIEDQQILVWNEYDKNGKPVTKARFKVIGDTLKKLEGEVASAGGTDLAVSAIKGVTTEAHDALAAKIVEAIKGIAIQAKNGAELRDKDIQRAKEVLGLWEKAKPTMADSASKAFTNYYSPWLQRIEKVAMSPIGAKAEWSTTEMFTKYDLPMVKPSAADARRWAKRDVTFIEKRIVNGRAQATGNVLHVSVDGIQSTFAQEIDGVSAHYWGGSKVPFAMQGTLELTLEGEGAGVIEKMIGAIEKLGINSERAGLLDREELYLRQIAYHRNFPDMDELFKAMANQPTQENRIAYAKKWLNNKFGTDITKSPGYNPQGFYQAFNQGRLLTSRPDLLLDKEWKQFTEGYRLYHANTGGKSMPVLIETILSGGGQMAPTVDKLRRGIALGGMSPEADLRSGGANYFFTRLKPVSTQQAGFYWRSDLVARLDAISYDSDMYGRTTGTTVRDNRKSTISDWKAAAHKGSNETIFKNSLSIFDGLDVIRVKNEEELQKVVAVFKKHGYTRFPDGRRIEEVIKVYVP